MGECIGRGEGTTLPSAVSPLIWMVGMVNAGFNLKVSASRANAIPKPCVEAVCRPVAGSSSEVALWNASGCDGKVCPYLMEEYHVTVGNGTGTMPANLVAIWSSLHCAALFGVFLPPPWR